MKIIKEFLLIFLCVNTFLAEKVLDFTKTRVLLIGIDGILSTCLNKIDNSVMDMMKKKGSSTMFARTAIESLSGPGWSGILCGMNTETTGVTSNEWTAPWIFGKKSKITPITGLNKPFPCIFEEIKKQKPDARVVGFFSWDWFMNLGNMSIPDSLDKEYVCITDDLKTSIECDVEALEKAKLTIDQDFDFFFLYIASLDISGHTDKFCSDKYVERFNQLNKAILEIFDYLKEKGIFDTTHIILTTDHGASYMTEWHGEQTDDNLYVPWMIMGPGIKSNYKIENYTKNLDTSPTIMKLFGLKPNKEWRRDSEAVDEVFEIENDLEEKFLNSM